ncbi:MAG: hypothetical protein ACJAQT_002866 [Akkermansiaceae bacterium]|jgi:hypothetical protein
MKSWVLLIFVCLGISLKGEVETRAYRAELKSFEYSGYSGPLVLPNGESAIIYKGEAMKEAPFESRFFGEGDGLLDYTGWARSVGILGKGAAVYNERTGRLVVRAEARHHRLLHDYLKQFLVWQFRAEVRVFRVPGVVLGRRDLQVAAVEKEGEELTGLSGLVMPGQTMELRTWEESLWFEAECQGWFQDTTWECRFNLVSELPEVEFSLKSSVVGAMGVPTMLELGSFDGKSTLVASLKVSQVLADGSDFDDWVQVEKGGNVLLEERLEKDLHKNREWVDLENGKRHQTFVLPPTFWEFITTVEGGKAKNIRELLKENGVALQDDDRVIWLKQSGLLTVEMSPLNLELLKGITTVAGISDPPPVLGCSYTLVESTEKLADFEKGGFRVLRKICANGLPGQRVDLKFGEGDLELGFEGQVSGSDDFVDSRATIRFGKKEVLKSEAEGKVGVPMILKQEKVGEVWQTWVGTFSARFSEDTIKEGR